MVNSPLGNGAISAICNGMDEKSLTLLEFPKVLERLAQYCAFPASEEKARRLRPTPRLEVALKLQAETSEALRLLTNHPDLTIGGARDVRGLVDLARRGGVLTTSELLDIKSTLSAARNLKRIFERWAPAYPALAQIADQLPAPYGIIDAISQAVSDRAEVLDSASEKLSEIRRELRVVHERLMAKLQRIVSDSHNTGILQEALITTRDGRYVVPLRAEFKGRLKSVVHDQSASGATLFVEPLSIVEQNNQYRELQLAERDEERRILTELSRQVGAQADELMRTVDTIATLDLALARARYSDAIRGVEPELKPIGGRPGIPEPEPEQNIEIETQASHEATEAGQEVVGQGEENGNAAASPGDHGKKRKTSVNKPHPQSTMRLYQARHPLLDPQVVVPIDVELDPQVFTLVITGPNTGGKTVTLKTVGLLALMAQSGLHIPAQSGSQISVFENVYADIGDEQSIEQSLSTFSGHINNIIRILNRANPRTLVILDELGAGTDPQEGAALARAILTNLVRRGITTLVTTHHPELKAFAHATPGVENASVEFDLQTLRPTFRLMIGLPGRSNALAIAERLGLPRNIVEAARSELHPDDRRADNLLDEIYRQRDLARQARQALEASRQEAETLRRQLAERLEKIEDERRKVLEQAQAEGQRELEMLRAELEEVRRKLRRMSQPLQDLKSIEEELEALEEAAEQPVERLFPTPLAKLEREEPGEDLRRPLRLGDRVRLPTLNLQGVISAIAAEEAEVQMGNLRVRARLDELERAAPGSESPALEGQSTRQPAQIRTAPAQRIQLPVSPGMELDLRGQRGEEALEALDRYLDAAFLAGLPFVRIIHGKGTGKLRELVRQSLRDHPQVKSFEMGKDQEGGDGVTVVRLEG